VDPTLRLPHLFVYSEAAAFKMSDAAFGNLIRSSNGVYAISVHTPWTLAPSLLIGITFTFRRFASPHDITIVDQNTGNRMSRVNLQRWTSDHCALHQVAHFHRELQVLHTWNISNYTQSSKFVILASCCASGVYYAKSPIHVGYGSDWLVPSS